jgi:hypothetical protein
MSTAYYMGYSGNMVRKRHWSVCWMCNTRRYSGNKSAFRCKPCGVQWNGAREPYDHSITIAREKSIGYIDFGEEWSPSPDCTGAGWVDDSKPLPIGY